MELSIIMFLSDLWVLCFYICLISDLADTIFSRPYFLEGSTILNPFLLLVPYVPFQYPTTNGGIFFRFSPKNPSGALYGLILFYQLCRCSCPSSFMSAKPCCRSASYTMIATELLKFSDRVSPIIGMRTQVSRFSIRISSGMPALSLPNMMNASDS